MKIMKLMANNSTGTRLCVPWDVTTGSDGTQRWQGELFAKGSADFFVYAITERTSFDYMVEIHSQNYGTEIDGLRFTDLGDAMDYVETQLALVGAI
jgi:hypothetical protein